MTPLMELKNLKLFLKHLINQEIKQKDQLTKKLFQYYPLEIAKNIIGKIEHGEDPSSVVTAFLSWDENKKINYGNVKWID